jgi:hypothetical protein
MYSRVIGYLAPPCHLAVFSALNGVLKPAGQCVAASGRLQPAAPPAHDSPLAAGHRFHRTNRGRRPDNR